jgi:hypothetical protein
MASLIDNLKNRRTDRIVPLDFTDIDKRTKAVTGQQETLRERIIELDAQLGEAAARAPLSDEHRALSKELQAANEDLHLLNQAFDGLKAEREKMIALNSAANAEKMRRDCNAFIDATVADAAALATAAEAFATAYQKMILHSRRTRQSIPIGHAVSDGVLTPGMLRNYVSAELFRLCAEKSGQSIGRDEQLLPPGAGIGDIMLLDNPGAIEPLVSKVQKEAAAFRAAIGVRKEPAK